MVAAFGLSAAAAYATGVFGSDSTITACVNKKSGAVRIVDKGGSCESTEYALSWLQAEPGIPDFVRSSATVHFSDGLLDQSRSRGVVQATRYLVGDTATYCVWLGFVPKNVTTSEGLRVSNNTLQAPVPVATALAGEPEMNLPFIPCPTARAIFRVFEPAGSFADFYAYLT